ncbi:PAB-dependent poly-specific ribonuclease subunit PAN3 [Drechmeria coniospora]|uniref:PAN2-PAN3 deadenylation complex subunit PAN3 n=1 Tax=Drechmeria coniospora TaxID=98403 RepID=A0A151GIW3_DRECN|nr:PAB-dependent poly-specific ribonuclease subunit PAN3 [Drechmeria coniospora]KYK57019.1 PAB-dependent poly-specific ribonuclease subunit PAN3 [Drechmeria coniospora]
MTTSRFPPSDLRRQVGSPRPKGRGSFLLASSDPATPADADATQKTRRRRVETSRYTDIAATKTRAAPLLTTQTRTSTGVSSTCTWTFFFLFLPLMLVPSEPSGNPRSPDENATLDNLATRRQSQSYLGYDRNARHQPRHHATRKFMLPSRTSVSWTCHVETRSRARRERIFRLLMLGGSALATTVLSLPSSFVRHMQCTHDAAGVTMGSPPLASRSKKALNVESPSFTPTSVQPAQIKKPTFSTQAATAPAFTPRALGARTPTDPAADSEAAVFNPAAIREFTPSLDVASQVSASPPHPVPLPLTPSQAGVNGSTQDGGAVSFDPFAMAAVGQSLPAAQYNPYADDHAMAAAGAASFFPHQAPFTTPLQPLQHHLYAPVGPHRDDLMPYHRVTHDFFLAEKLREELQKKSEASLQMMPNSQLPQLDNYHSLVALDTTHRKNADIYGYPSWVYKAFSSKNGNLYCLRRLEGFRLTNENAIRSVKEWRKVDNGNVVTIHDAFTTRAFGDSSLIFVQDYHPLSKTLTELHLTAGPGHGSRFQPPKGPIAETTLWGYISQIANALRAIHATNLAARCIDVSKILLTHKNRIRLNACSVLDVVQFDSGRTTEELQQDDFVQFGRTMLSLATNTPPVHLTNLQASLEQMGRSYSVEMRDTIVWLLSPPRAPARKTIDEFIRGIAGHIVASFDQGLHQADELNTALFRELENGRAARLLLKLGTVNERFEFDGDRAWSENGERYMLKLFRDYVFHQVDGNGNPVLDVGHMLRCLSRLDAGTDERVCLTSRDEQTSFLVSYKELKKQLGNAFGELQSTPGALQARVFGDAARGAGRAASPLVARHQGAAAWSDGRGRAPSPNEACKQQPRTAPTRSALDPDLPPA